MKAVLKHLAEPFNAKARKSLTPSPQNMRNNSTTGYKAVWHYKPYYQKVIKKNGKDIRLPAAILSLKLIRAWPLAPVSTHPPECAWKQLKISS